MSLNRLSSEYILYACDGDFELAEKLCGRLNGLYIRFSTTQLSVLKAQKLLLEGMTPKEVAEEVGMLLNSVQKIKRRMIREGLVYYVGEDK